MFVYVIVCSESLKLYVGQHKGADLGKYLAQKWYAAHKTQQKTRSHLYNAMRRHPRESWSIHPLVSGIEDKKELDELEKHFIKVLKCQHPEIGYNICDGGEGHTGPGPWLGKKHPLKNVRKRPGWRNATVFVKGSAPWNKGKFGYSSGKTKQVYTSDDAKQKAVQNLLRGRAAWEHMSEETRKNQIERLAKLNAEAKNPERRAKLQEVHGANGTCRCPAHVAIRNRR